RGANARGGHLRGGGGKDGKAGPLKAAGEGEGPAKPQKELTQFCFASHGHPPGLASFQARRSLTSSPTPRPSRSAASPPTCAISSRPLDPMSATSVPTGASPYARIRPCSAFPAASTSNEARLASRNPAP